MNFFFEEKPHDEAKEEYVEGKKEKKEKHEKKKDEHHEKKSEESENYLGIPEHWSKVTKRDDGTSSLF